MANHNIKKIKKNDKWRLEKKQIIKNRKIILKSNFRSLRRISEKESD